MAAPVLSNLAIDWGGLEIIEQLPARLPDMGLDAPLRGRRIMASAHGALHSKRRALISSGATR